MLRLIPDKILIYYDIPQLFTAIDQVGARYICLNVESETEYATYIAVPVSVEKMNALVLGTIDLRKAFQVSETGIWYKVTFNENEEIITEPFDFDIVSEKYLPSAGFYFPRQAIGDEQQSIPSLEKEKIFKVGDVVFINSDNHIKLTISAIDEKGLADCVYYDNKDKRLRHEKLNINTLTPTLLYRTFDFL